MGKKKQKKCKSDFKKSIITKDAGNSYEAAIKELSFINKSNGLVVGTNETLRRLEKEQLAAVYLFAKKASPPVYHSLSLSCRKLHVPFITLQDKDKFVLGPKFPTSITYGVKKECLKSLPTLDNLLNKIITGSKKEKKPPTVACEAAVAKPEVPKVEKPSRELDPRSFYHEKHAVDSVATTEWTDLDCLVFSTDKAAFPDYDSLHKPCEFSFSIK